MPLKEDAIIGNFTGMFNRVCACSLKTILTEKLVRGTYRAMIQNFKCKETQDIWDGYKSRKLPGHIQNRALVKLRQLAVATTLEDLKVPPSNHLEPLKGDRKNQWSIRINQQWRICFMWNGSEALNVEIVDYH